MKNKRKESDTNEEVSSPFPLRMKKKMYREDVVGGLDTLSLVEKGRGLKRKIGCIDIATHTGRTKKDIDYITGVKLGEGKFGCVSICRSRVTGKEYACKTLRKGEEIVHREVEIMQHLSGHPGVVTLQAVYEDPHCYHLVMELCEGGRLKDLMVREGHCSEHIVAGIFKEVMLAIKHCHDMGVVHRDVKPENILLTKEGDIKLADFGMAMRFSKGQNLTSLAGTPAYVAPEVLLGKYSEKVDIWSAGVLLHALLIGSLPFKGNTVGEVFEAIKNIKVDLRKGMWESISKPARDLVGRMLTRDISARISADEVLSHPWILFYTEHTSKTLSFESRLKNQNGAAATCHITSKHNVEISSSLSSSESCNSEYNDNDCVWIDAISAAISHVRISEPEKNKLSSIAPIVMNANLCKAF